MKFKTFFSKIIDSVLRGKIYMVRTTSYISLLNSGMLLFLFLVSLKERGSISFEVDNWFFPIMVGGFFVFLFIGWAEVKFFRGLQREGIIGFRYNPELMNLKTKVDEIHNHLFKEGKKDGK